MKEMIRYGIVGLGNQGTNYALNLFEKGKIKDSIVTAMCDINPKKIERMKSQTKMNVEYFIDYKAMVDSGLIDALLVETPHYIHPEIAEYALTHNVHVILEKPAGVYTKQVRLLNEIASKSNLQFTMMFNQRTNCVYRAMRKMILDGKIGEFQRVTWIITDWFRTKHYYDTGAWRATWKGEGGGVLINQCPHQLDLVQWVINKSPIAVHGFCQYGKWHDIEVEDEVTAFFEYDNGATGVFITTTGETPGTNRLEVSGTLGKLICENDELYFYENDMDSQKFSLTSNESFSRPNIKKVKIETDNENPQHAGIINNFSAALLGKEKLFINGQEGIKGVELMNAIELSGWLNGQRVTLPVDEELYLQHLNEHCLTSSYHEDEDDIMIEDMTSSYGLKK